MASFKSLTFNMFHYNWRCFSRGLNTTYVFLQSLSSFIEFFVQLIVKIKLMINIPLREKCPNTESFLVFIFPYSVRIQGNTDQKKLRIWTLFTQCSLLGAFTKRCSKKKAVLKKIRKFQSEIPWAQFFSSEAVHLKLCHRNAVSGFSAKVLSVTVP